MELITLATLSLLLAVKHTICDLAIQRLFPADKKFYFNPPAHTHYFHHAVGSFLIGTMIDFKYAILIGIIDYIAHWHIDYAKTLIKNHYGLTQSDNRFWVLQSIDQALHFATYYLFLLIAIIW
jgi:hypothetical protein